MVGTMSPDSIRAKNLRDRYGMTVAEYDGLLHSQGGVCAICETDTPGGRGRFHVDHCHESGKIRGLLCNDCNVGIGRLADDALRCIQAAKYLLNGGYDSQ